MSERRVVITGIGLLTPLGWGREISWKRILAGQSGAGRITTFDTTDYACQIAAEVPRVDGRGGGGPDIEGSFDPEQVMAPKDRRRIDDFILYAMAAADEAVKDSGWAPEDEAGRERTGVIIGSGIGKVVTYPGVESVEGHPTMMFFSSGEFIDAEAETVEKMSTAINAAMDFAAENPDAVREKAIEMLDLDPALAEKEGRRILEEARARFGVIEARAVHRTGPLVIGDVAVWVGVAAAHRDAAFAACRYVIDELKRRVPIWKRERYADGAADWVKGADPEPGPADPEAG